MVSLNDMTEVSAQPRAAVPTQQRFESMDIRLEHVLQLLALLDVERGLVAAHMPGAGAGQRLLRNAEEGADPVEARLRLGFQFVTAHDQHLLRGKEFQQT